MIFSKNVSSVFVLSLWLACLTQARGNEEEMSSKIVGGVDASENYPWMVSLQVYGEHFCAASLIHPEWAVSAAHCYLGSSSVQVVRGIKDLRDTSNVEMERRDAIFTIPHPNYDSFSFEHDIMLIKVNAPFSVSNGELAALPTGSLSNLNAGTILDIIGWGTTSEGGNAANYLQYAQVPLQDCGTPKECFLCAGYDEGGIDSCQGDSGGPMFLDNAGTHTLIGVVSHGMGCARPGEFGVYSNVSLYGPWIDQVLNAGPALRIVDELSCSTFETIEPTRTWQTLAVLGDRYQNNMRACWFLIASAVEIQFESFYLEADYDFLDMMSVSMNQYDQVNVIESYSLSGFQTIADGQMPGPVVVLRMRSDSSMTRDGFELRFRQSQYEYPFYSEVFNPSPSSPTPAGTPTTPSAPVGTPTTPSAPSHPPQLSPSPSTNPSPTPYPAAGSVNNQDTVESFFADVMEPHLEATDEKLGALSTTVELLVQLEIISIAALALLSVFFCIFAISICAKLNRQPTSPVAPLMIPYSYGKPGTAPFSPGSPAFPSPPNSPSAGILPDIPVISNANT